ncbi:ATP-binding cassette domain-containing protein [Saccharopolyspora erythraea]|uniref:ATP-binding cassette domain-containing protein n=1 Tax=Saccharopolyspora erythraea TaxID=1836 RepID=UPI0024AFE5FC|nr:ATP-binding cassette domain-containing protein [Saccharopolyspora erythraea]
MTAHIADPSLSSRSISHERPRWWRATTIGEGSVSEIRVESLHKIFGPNPEDATRRPRNGSITTEDLRSEGVTAAVIDASSEVRQGETFVVMGLSGSGKSTLIRMLNGLLSPTSGHVHLDGRDITAMSRKELRLVRQRFMSMVFQHFALLPHRTVLDNAAYALAVQELPTVERLEKAPASRARQRALSAGDAPAQAGAYAGADPSALARSRSSPARSNQPPARRVRRAAGADVPCDRAWRPGSGCCARSARPPAGGAR